MVLAGSPLWFVAHGTPALKVSKASNKELNGEEMPCELTLSPRIHIAVVVRNTVRQTGSGRSTFHVLQRVLWGAIFLAASGKNAGVDHGAVIACFTVFSCFTFISAPASTCPRRIPRYGKVKGLRCREGECYRRLLISALK